MKLSPARVGLIVLGAALLGISVFGILVADVTRVTDLDAAAAESQFDAVLDSLDSGPPRLTRDGTGGFTNSTGPAGNIGVAPAHLGVLAFQADHNRFIRSEVPFWFFRLKGPVVRLALRGSGFDLDRLGLTPSDIARQGAGVILDESWPNGDRVLVWAE